MAEAHYVRLRGRVTGPFDLPSLQKMVRRGHLSRLHEISQDRRIWSPADEFEDLFPREESQAAPPAVAHAGMAQMAGAAGAGPGRAVQDEAPTAASEVPYYFSRDGVASGPVPALVLLGMAADGRLKATDLVWRAGTQVALPAVQQPLLAPVLLRETSYPNHAAQAPEATSLVRRIGFRSTVTGIAASALTLLALNLPVGVVEGEVYWWWDGLGRPGNGWYATFCFFFLFAGLGVGAVALLVGGLARGVAFVACAGAVLVLLLVASLAAAQPSQAFIATAMAYLIPCCAAAVWSSSRFLAHERSSTAGRACLIIFGAGLTVAALTVFIYGVADSGARPPVMPSWAVASFALIMLSLGVAVVTGLMSLAGAARAAPRGLLVAVTVLSYVTVGLLGLGLIVAAAGVATLLTDRHLPLHALPAAPVLGVSAGNLFFLMARSLLLFWSMVAVLGAGMSELLAASRTGAGGARSLAAGDDRTGALSEAVGYVP